MTTPLVVLMGVTGSGKSTVGFEVARELGVVFRDGDSYHDAAAVAAMRQGQPLDDAARAPWLERLHEALVEHRADGVVLACSCLKASHRDVIAKGIPEVRFVLLRVPEDVLARRLELRRGHFAGVDLLPSQLATLEVTDDLLVVDADAASLRVTERVIDMLTGASGPLR